MANNSTLLYIHLTLVDHLNRLPILVLVIIIGVLVSAFNMFTISIIIISKRLRQPFNYPIISVLLGATLQSLFTVPAYAFKRLDTNIIHDRESWICDVHRFPYYICGHILKISLMVVSFDRLVAVKYPYRYKTIINKRVYTIAITFIWVSVILIDTIPFFPIGKIPDEEGCTYIPEHIWGIIVIVTFNLFPFLIIGINYIIIWRVAAKITIKDLSVRKSISRSTRLAHNNTKQFELIEMYKASHCSLKTSQLTRSNVPLAFDSDFMAEQNINTRKRSYINAINGVEDDFSILESDINSESAIDIRERKAYPVPSNALRILWEMKATKTSITLLFVYVICWGPLGVYYLIDNCCATCLTDNLHVHVHVDRFILKIISFFSSIFLPLVYCWRTKQFRNESFRFVCKGRQRKRTFWASPDLSNRK